MSVEIDVICSGVPDLQVAWRVADLVLCRCLNEYTPFDTEIRNEVITLRSSGVLLTAMVVPQEYHEFPGEVVVSIRSEERAPRSYIACLVVSAALAYCFDGWFDLANWTSSRVANPARILAECLSHENTEAGRLLERLSELI
jgi:hypothetical protein